MLSLILAICLLSQAPSQIPEIHAAALADLLTVPPEQRRDIRYLSLHAASPGEQRESLYRATLFALNSTSFRTTFTKPVLSYKGLLIRLHLSSIGWDTGHRSARIERLKSQGVDVSTFKADLWEEISLDDPYFAVTVPYNGTVLRGWVDPVVDAELRKQTYASRAIVRADWLVTKILLEKENGGYYSQALLHPPKESDFYKVYALDESRFASDAQLHFGGVVADSFVALHARELQLVHALYGRDEQFLWRTFDFASDGLGDQSPIEKLGGTVRHDGREIITTLPNGLHAYYLADGKGTQVAVVPQAIAIDQRSGVFERLKDRSVISAYKCVSCHGPSGGIQPFQDIIADAILSPNIGLAVFAYGSDRQNVLRETLSEYYLTDLPSRIRKQNASYTARLKECNGLDPGANAVAVNDVVESYIYGLVTPEQAAREMGVDLPVARVQWRTSGNSYLVLLSAGKSIRRAAWESAFRDAMTAATYPWEKAK